MKVSVACLLAIAWIAGIGIVPPAFATDAADRAAIEAGAQAWAKAFNARDASALIALATEDLVLLDPNAPPVSGPGAREAWKTALGAAQGQLTSASKEIVIAGDVAWRIAELTYSAPRGDAVKRGQALEIWKRVAGEWKIHRQMSSNVLTHPTLSPPPSEPVLDRPAN